jgi:hypothetical protein
MPNTIITPDIIAREALIHAKNNRVMSNRVHTEYKKEFVKVGNTVNIRKPVKFEVSDGAARQHQDVSEESIPFVIDKRKHVSWGFDTESLTLSIEEYSERYIKPAVIGLMNTVDADLTALYKDVYQTVGTAGTTPATFKAFAQSNAELDRFATPMDPRSLVLDVDSNLNLADVLSGKFSAPMVEGAVRDISTGRVGTMMSYMDQNIKTHTAGTNSGDTAYKVNGDAQEGSTLTIDTGAGTFVKGDIFSIAGCFSVNPVSRESTGEVQKFTVTADMASGGTEVSISPAIITSGAYQTVVASPADDANLTIVATHQANLAFHKNAFGLVTVPLILPDSSPFKARREEDGMSVRVLKAYNEDTDDEVIRLDLLYGVKAIQF